jgi:hypothetical protein
MRVLFTTQMSRFQALSRRANPLRSSPRTR